MKAFVSSLLVASAPAYAPAPYHPAPAPYHPENVPPKPFAYEYGGADEYGRHFAKTETQDEYGVVQGEYRVELPDGRVQIVSYHADHENGFIADVRYEGEAHPEPAYHPAPAPAPYAPRPRPRGSPRCAPRPRGGSPRGSPRPPGRPPCRPRCSPRGAPGPRSSRSPRCS